MLAAVNSALDNGMQWRLRISLLSCITRENQSVSAVYKQLGFPLLREKNVNPELRKFPGSDPELGIPGSKIFFLVVLSSGLEKKNRKNGKPSIFPLNVSSPTCMLLIKTYDGASWSFQNIYAFKMEIHYYFSCILDTILNIDSKCTDTIFKINLILLLCVNK